MKIKKIVSGGQSGVDRAALDVARQRGLEIGGWCPRGRLAEDGPLSRDYPLRETPKTDYRQRTAWNVRDSDATLILHRGELSGGTALTADLARRQGSPCLLVNLLQPPLPEMVLCWTEEKQVRVLNVAGPRESQQPGIYALASRFLDQVLDPDRKRVARRRHDPVS
ncbi:MAG: putative molybdenum carrier protein [Acidobacteriota bacterium]